MEDNKKLNCNSDQNPSNSDAPKESAKFDLQGRSCDTDSLNISSNFKIPNKSVSVRKASDVDNNVSDCNTLDSNSSKKGCESINDYKLPPWSKCPEDSNYELTEIKSGVIVKKIKLSKSHYIIGRFESNDIVMGNPTVSRHHAALQYGDPSGGNNNSWYLFDLNSTHGTFINKKNRVTGYSKLEDGSMFKLGLSVRFFVLDKVSTSPSVSSSEDSEEDEVKDSYCINMVNSLKQWFQNEGLTPEFEVDNFDRVYSCKIKLPLKEIYGEESEDFEGVGRGKTKDEAIYDAVSECWDYLESIGVTPAGIKRTKNWKENDYYDSDEDPYFDRTGELERKRLKRMKEEDDKSRPNSNQPKKLKDSKMSDALIKYTSEQKNSLLSERENLVQYLSYLKNEIDKMKNDVDNEENGEVDELIMKNQFADLDTTKNKLLKIDEKLKKLEEELALAKKD